MASVQAMPSMQAGMAALPPNITQEQVQQAYQVSHYDSFQTCYLDVFTFCDVMLIYVEISTHERAEGPTD